jgi:hypothetical protein
LFEFIVLYCDNSMKYMLKYLPVLHISFFDGLRQPI